MGKTVILGLSMCLVGLVVGASVTGMIAMTKIKRLKDHQAMQEQKSMMAVQQAQTLVEAIQEEESARAEDLATIAALEDRVRELELERERAEVPRQATPVRTATVKPTERTAARQPAEDDAKPQDEAEEEASHTALVETVERVRSNVQQFYDEQLANTTDPERQERLLALSEYANHGLDVRMRINETVDPAEKQELFLDLRVTYANHDQYLRAEQAAQLIETAAGLGITDPGQQDAFVDAVARTIRDPFFNQNAPQLGGRGVPVPVQR